MINVWRFITTMLVALTILVETAPKPASSGALAARL